MTVEHRDPVTDACALTRRAVPPVALRSPRPVPTRHDAAPRTCADQQQLSGSSWSRMLNPPAVSSPGGSIAGMTPPGGTSPKPRSSPLIALALVLPYLGDPLRLSRSCNHDVLRSAVAVMFHPAYLNLDRGSAGCKRRHMVPRLWSFPSPAVRALRSWGGHPLNTGFAPCNDP